MLDFSSKKESGILIVNHRSFICLINSCSFSLFPQTQVPDCTELLRNVLLISILSYLKIEMLLIITDTATTATAITVIISIKQSLFLKLITTDSNFN